MYLHPCGSFGCIGIGARLLEDDVFGLEDLEWPPFDFPSETSMASLFCSSLPLLFDADELALDLLLLKTLPPWFRVEGSSTVMAVDDVAAPTAGELR